MSYILDALNRADSERERQRSAVPGLQSYADAQRAVPGGNAWRWIALGAIVALAAVLAWQWFSSTAEPAPAVAAAAPPMPQPIPTPMPTPPEPVPLPAPAPSPMQQTAPPAPTVAAAPPAKIVPPPAPVARAAPAVAAPKPAAATQAASAPARLPTRNELPPELRAALPPISISGAVHAPRPADRLLFANGLVLKEGDALADGLTVERIGASSSVLAFRGQRFELKH